MQCLFIISFLIPVGRCTILWVKHWLDVRAQRVDGVTSTWQLIRSDVPQKWCTQCWGQFCTNQYLHQQSAFLSLKKSKDKTCALYACMSLTIINLALKICLFSLECLFLESVFRSQYLSTTDLSSPVLPLHGSLLLFSHFSCTWWKYKHLGLKKELFLVSLGSL